MTANATLLSTGHTTRLLTEAEIRTILDEALRDADIRNQRVLVIIPDGTRSAPMPLLFKQLCDLALPQAKALDFLVALGTHVPMSDAALNKMLGLTPEQRASTYARVNIFNHEWAQPETFATIGHISAGEISTITNGMLKHAADVTINKKVLEYDRIFVCGPVFPHEVAGFSGGNKYFFPGISGPDVIHLSHWIGALVTNFVVIGTKHTPVRAVFDRAASMIPTPKTCLAFVVKDGGLAGLFAGSMEDAWSAAADLSAQTHIVTVPKPFKQVLSVMPPMYEDLWTASKGMYKLEPVVADGGEVIIYAPNLKEISFVHGKVLDEIGYHVRDYFVKQWDTFKHHPWGIVAHSTHLRGMGTFENGIERPRITVTIASQISEARCRAVNLSYRDPASIDVESFANREAEGVLLVRKAGEMLYRLKK